MRNVFMIVFFGLILSVQASDKPKVRAEVSTQIVTNNVNPIVKENRWLTFTDVSCIAMTNMLWYGGSHDNSSEIEKARQEERTFPKTSSSTIWISENTNYKIYVDDELIIDKTKIKLLKTITTKTEITQKLFTNVVETVILSTNDVCYKVNQ